MIERIWQYVLLGLAFLIGVYGWLVMLHIAGVPDARFVAICAIFSFSSLLSREVLANLKIPPKYSRRSCWWIAGWHMLRSRDWKHAREAFGNVFRRRTPILWSTGVSIRDGKPR